MRKQSSRTLQYTDFESNWYRKWAKLLKQNKEGAEDYALRANKFWQNAVMAQILDEKGALKSKNTGIGFGVGQERLPALFARMGVNVTATDQDHRTDKAKHWQKYELATGTVSLNRLGICPQDKFEANVNYAPVDMNHIPKQHYGSYDFAWSNCALGHLGSIENGLNFIVNSAKCLKIGGTAVHTTEINTLSNDETVDNNPETVIFRPKDLYLLSKMLAKHGLVLEVPNFSFGDTEHDQRISIKPEFGNDYSKLQVGGHIITQIVLIIHKPKKTNLKTKSAALYKHRVALAKNITAQKKFKANNPLITEILRLENKELSDDSIIALQSSKKISINQKPKSIYLGFKNSTDMPLFSMHNRLWTTKPIALGTSNPTDRKSSFVDKSWHNGQANRPPIAIYEKAKDGSYNELDYVKPGQTFYFEVKLNATKLKSGTYKESFTVVQEGNRYFAKSEVTVTVLVAS